MIACCNPFDAAGRDAVQQSLDYTVAWYLARPGAIIKALQDVYRLESRAGIVTGTAVVPDPGGVRVTILTSSRWPEPAARVLRGLVRARRPRRR